MLNIYGFLCDIQQLHPCITTNRVGNVFSEYYDLYLVSKESMYSLLGQTCVDGSPDITIISGVVHNKYALEDDSRLFKPPIDLDLGYSDNMDLHHIPLNFKFKYWILSLDNGDGSRTVLYNHMPYHRHDVDNRALSHLLRVALTVLSVNHADRLADRLADQSR